MRDKEGSVEAQLRRQATIFGKHLLKKTPGDLAHDLYVKAMLFADPEISKQDLRLLDFAVQHPWSVSLLDAGLALSRPQAELRRRIYTMFAILETMPEHAYHFLPKQRSPLYALWFGVLGAKAAAKAVAGIALVKVVQ